MNIMVSVIIPVYKTPQEYLRKCFDSLLTQTMQKCEFILVSDGAPETECSVCEEYVQKDSRFIFFRREHAGVSTARNFGISQAHGEYITFVDSDDWIEKETCQAAYEYAKKNNSDMVFWDLFFNIPHKKNQFTQFHSSHLPSLSYEQTIFFQKNTIHAQKSDYLNVALPFCKLIKMDFLKKNAIQFDIILTRGEDRVFNSQIIQHIKHLSYLKIPLYHYRIHFLSTEQSYHEYGFRDLLCFIQTLNRITDRKYPISIANETISCYFSCIYKLFQYGLSLEKLHQEISFLKKQIKSETFHELIQKANSSNWSLLERVEVFLMKKKISSLFFILVFKAKLYHIYSQLRHLAYTFQSCRNQDT